MGFYSTNNAKFRAYNVSRRKEQEYYEDQQDDLDEMLAEQRGDIAMASRYAKLAKSVINAFGDEVQKKVPGATAKATDYLGELITTGRLSEAFDKIKKMGLEGLSPEAQDIVKDIQNPITRKAITSKFNSSLEKIAIENATPEQRVMMVETAKAETDVLRRAAKNPGLVEAVAARARQLAETRDAAVYEKLGIKRPRNDALLNSITAARANLKPSKGGLRETLQEIIQKGESQSPETSGQNSPKEYIAEAFTDSLTKAKMDRDEFKNALDEILEKAVKRMSTSDTTNKGKQLLPIDVKNENDPLKKNPSPTGTSTTVGSATDLGDNDDDRRRWTKDDYVQRHIEYQKNIGNPLNEEGINKLKARSRNSLAQQYSTFGARD